ncbi:hypothetical protein [Nevskia ramosa]|uniref:hypothetical protein n=1 Tax=Nevskia ramosa TaxID=64002 RepID=UPI0003B741FA|nr:hypothetical protein [Nevskia ramosa]
MAIASRSLSVLAGAVLSLAAASASAQSSNGGSGTNGSGYEVDNTGAPSGMAMAADLLIARPLGLAATLLGTAVFVVSLPFQALAGNFADPAQSLVVEPATFTFTRPLGQGVN